MNNDPYLLQVPHVTVSNWLRSPISSMLPPSYTSSPRHVPFWSILLVFPSKQFFQLALCKNLNAHISCSLNQIAAQFVLRHSQRVREIDTLECTNQSLSSRKASQPTSCWASFTFSPGYFDFSLSLIALLYLSHNHNIYSVSYMPITLRSSFFVLRMPIDMRSYKNV